MFWVEGRREVTEIKQNILNMFCTSDGAVFSLTDVKQKSRVRREDTVVVSVMTKCFFLYLTITY